MSEVNKSLKMPSNVEGIFFERKQKLGAQWQTFVNEGSKHSEMFESELSRALTFSNFVAEYIFSLAEAFSQSIHENIFYIPRCDEFYQKELTQKCSDCETLEEWMGELRKFRNREMLRYIWREVNQLSSLQESVREISAFASAAIDVSLNFLYQNFCEKYGVPLSSSTNTRQSLSVLGMGKLGGGELNLSSDIDLIFFYGEGGHCEKDGKRTIENQQFFTRLAQQLIKVLDERTVDGFVFRVDMRLRPYGEDGMLVLNEEAMELYYETQGRTWERYAFIKASCIAGDIAQGENFLKNINPFMYRKYVDFSVLESLREMKLLINRQVINKGLVNDIKLGEGGIRETEFIVQAIQLIQGGRKPGLQQRSYFRAMEEVVLQGFMSHVDAQTLVEHYLFYRRLEHLLQGEDDKQTQLLPSNALKQECIAWVMGKESYDDLLSDLASRRTFVREIFDDLFSVEDAGDSSSSEFNLDFYQGQWFQLIKESISFSGLDEECSKELSDVFSSFANEKILMALSENEKKRIDWCMAYLVYKIVDFENPVNLLGKAIRFLKAILKRSVYMVLLSENPKVFDYLLSLFQRSEWVLDNLLQHPFLLDELLQLQNNKKVVNIESLPDELRQLCLRMDNQDLETVLEELRVFKCAHEMQAAALYLDKDLTTSDLGDYLSALSEVLLNEVCHIAMDELCKDASDNYLREFIKINFAVLAYGKLGSRELGFGSDLDLVFIFNDTNKPEGDVGRMLTRYAQKIIHLLSARTYSGILYEVDMRLRPSGQSGPLVSSLNGFERYQLEDAWTWEHQALVKARVIVGSDNMRERFSRIRSLVLSLERDQKVLLKDMKDMQSRLRENSPAVNMKQKFHLKNDAGGIVDIEFLSQYLVLAYANQYPAIMDGHASLEIFNFVEAEPGLKPDWLPELRKLYFRYRRRVNELTLAYQKVMLEKPVYEQERARIQEVWKNLFQQFGVE